MSKIKITIGDSGLMNLINYKKLNINHNGIDYEILRKKEVSLFIGIEGE